MRFRLGLSSGAWSRAAACALVVATCGTLALELAACSAASAPSAGPEAGTGGGGGGGAAAGMGGAAQNKLTLALYATDDGHAVDASLLKPRDQVNVVATLVPAGDVPVRFALLGSGNGMPLDATFVGNAADVWPSSGQATVTLIAPSTPTTFSLRASAMGYPTALLDLTVRKTGQAHLTVSPRCPKCDGCAPATDPGCGGDPGRPITAYTASVFPNQACSELEGSPPPDATILKAESMTAPVPITVPAGTELAVVLRADKLAWGCTTLDEAIEGADNMATVAMTNVPMTFDTSELEVTLGLDSFAPLAGALTPTKQAILSAVIGKAADDVDALLTAMKKGSSDPSAFDSTRGAEKWDVYVSDAIGPTAPTAVRDPLTRWLDGGLAAMQANPALVAELRGGSGPGPLVTLTSILGLSPARSGFEPADTATWQASANDNVLIGLGMSFDPATLLLGAARGSAVAEIPGTNNLSEALANAIPCQKVALALVDHGESSGNSTDGCDRTCTQKLCSQAVAALLATAGTPAATPATLAVALTAAGRVGESAELVAFDGTWLGRLSLPDQANTPNLMGAASAVTLEPSTP